MIKEKIKELVEATLIIGVRRAADVNHDAAKELISQHIESLTDRFFIMFNNSGGMYKGELVKIIEGFSDFYHNQKDFDPPKGITTIIQEYVKSLPASPAPVGNEDGKKKCADTEEGIFNHNKGIFHINQCPVCYQSNVINPAASNPPVEQPASPLKEGQKDLLEQLYPESAAKPEYIICAAIWFKDGNKHEHQPKNVESGFVVCGRRHHNCFMVAHICLADSYSESKGTGLQGFLTSKDRFVDRKDAGLVAFNAGQTTEVINCLFSEDLY